MSWNDLTRQLVKACCLYNFDPKECSELPGGDQAKIYVAFNIAASRRFLSVPFFKVNEWLVQQYPSLPLLFAPSIILDAFREEYLFLSIYRLSLSFSIKYSWKKCWKNFLGAFFGYPYR